ncbi:MAG TPA: J domain-containing protein [Terriglobia bacterium]|nr:J domain-containing protein [Terriglobia bacterium]
MARIHYDILQIKPNASSEEIQRAYRKQALRYHPDRNPAPDAAARMAAINEAYEVLRDPESKSSAASHSGNVSQSSRQSPGDDLTFSIISAARAVILRSGWTLIQDDETIAVFEHAKEKIRVVLTDRLTRDSLLRLARQYREVSAILAVHVESRIAVGSRTTVVDLMRAERHGALIPDGACKSLLSSFL